MAAGTWKIYASAKKRIGAGTITLGAGIFKMSLHLVGASAAILVLSTRSKFSSIGSEIANAGGYPNAGAASGGRTILPATGQWTVGASAKQYKFTYTTIGLAFTASGAALSAIKYAALHFSSGAVTSGFVLCFVTLSTAAFSIASPNILTILPAATGVFTLA
jgi:hypothetical protein